MRKNFPTAEMPQITAGKGNGNVPRQLHILRECRIILETAESHNVVIAFTSEIQPCLVKKQLLLKRAPPAHCFEPGSAHQYCI